ncbi:MAG: hypothetical protein UY97_C0020G0001, partial [Parcubacteria group bacterium GW2011_GWB1_57_6]
GGGGGRRRGRRVRRLGVGRRVRGLRPLAVEVDLRGLLVELELGALRLLVGALLGDLRLLVGALILGVRFPLRAGGLLRGLPIGAGGLPLGFPIGAGYVEPLYLLPLFQKKQAFNGTHFPFDYNGRAEPDYRKGLCPVTERMHYREFVGTDVCQHPYTAAHIDAFAVAVKEVLAQAKKR